MFIEIIKGAYGRKVGAAVKPILRGETADLPDKEAARLISIGVARLAAREGERTVQGMEPVATVREVVCTEKELESMSFQELKAVAKQMGVEGVSAIRSREQLLEAIQELRDGEELFDLEAEEPEV